MTGAGLATVSPAALPAPAIAEETIRALVVDDAYFDRRRLIRACGMARLNLVFSEASTLNEMRRALAAGRHDIAFIDYRLPDGDGLEALNVLRADPLNGEAAAVMIAGESDAAVAVAAMKAGACNYLGKNVISPATLSETIAAAIGRPPPVQSAARSARTEPVQEASVAEAAPSAPVPQAAATVPGGTADRISIPGFVSHRVAHLPAEQQERLDRLARAAAGPAARDLERLIAASAWAVAEREAGGRLRAFLAEVAALGRGPRH